MELEEEGNISGLRSMVRAFRHRNFRLYFGGQSVSLIGTWVQQIALGWTIYQLTHSSPLLGLVSFAGQLPLFIVTGASGAGKTCVVPELRRLLPDWEVFETDILWDSGGDWFFVKYPSAPAISTRRA